MNLVLSFLDLLSEPQEISLMLEVEVSGLEFLMFTREETRDLQTISLEPAV
jgi:hypothetical protein